ncbi:MAG: hypothetical protein MUF15_23135 [Acidobacteria bacterium]|jgi:hypothetical protein|nr:hypothetical protein [Acidobacteriota bacterium]
MKSKKKEFEPLGPGMELIRGGVELEENSDWIICSCDPAEAYTSGQQGGSGCACGCSDGVGGVSNFNKAYMMQLPIWL